VLYTHIKQEWKPVIHNRVHPYFAPLQSVEHWAVPSLPSSSNPCI